MDKRQKEKFYKRIKETRTITLTFRNGLVTYDKIGLRRKRLFAIGSRHSAELIAYFRKYIKKDFRSSDYTEGAQK